MAEWKAYYWTSGESTASGDGLEISASSAISFGGGSRTDFQSNISVDSWNSAMHHAQDDTESSVDVCPAPHMHPAYPNSGVDLASDSGAFVDGAYVNMAAGTPDPARGIGFLFTHSYAVKCSPVQIWAYGSGTSDSPESCTVAIADLTLANPVWATVSPSNKLTCSAHTGADSEEHWWNFLIAVQPNAVGFEADNTVKVENIYY